MDLQINGSNLLRTTEGEFETFSEFLLPGGSLPCPGPNLEFIICESDYAIYFRICL